MTENCLPLQTAHAAAFALFQLARNSSVQTKLQRHVDRVLGSSAGPLAPEQLNEMPYIAFVLKETLRWASLAEPPNSRQYRLFVLAVKYPALR